MKRKFPPSRFLSLLLLVAMCAGIMIGDRARAQAPRISVLESWTDKVSPDLRELALSGSQDYVKVIVQFEAKLSNTLNTALNLKARKRVNFVNFNSCMVEVPASWIDDLAAFTLVKYISRDQETETLGHVSSTTGADAVRKIAGTKTGGLDGTGVGIAVLDSGIDTGHKAFLDKSDKLRVVVSKDFTGEGRTDDPYGHGTHVASTAAGNGRISNAQYIGVAPNANIINLRVLNAQGKGTVSGLLNALDWVMTNRSLYNIRVVSMSLGTWAVESYRNDPLCRAVRKLVDAGVVVVAAAGNNGKNSAGQKVYGQVHSPGNEPSALTVGASNSFGSDARGDDAVAS